MPVLCCSNTAVHNNKTNSINSCIIWEKSITQTDTLRPKIFYVTHSHTHTMISDNSPPNKYANISLIIVTLAFVSFISK